MGTTRREFVQSTSAAVAGLVGLNRVGMPDSLGFIIPPKGSTVGDPNMRELALKALDAAKGAGATFADVRIGRTQSLSFVNGGGVAIRLWTTEQLNYSVRVLVAGTWGFVGSNDISANGLGRAAKAAVEQAKMHSRGRKTPVVLAPVPVLNNVEWRMPIKTDPFSVPVNDQANMLAATGTAAYRVKGVTDFGVRMEWLKDERIFVSTEGSLTAQTFVRSSGAMSIFCISGDKKDHVYRELEFLKPASGGFEWVQAQDMEAQVEQQCEETVRLLGSPTVDVGKYDLILSGLNMSSPIADTLGSSLELDRALGMQAGTVGTSYAAPPKDVLGKMLVGSPLINLHANRAMPGAATVAWDDDGVKPQEYSVIKDGVVVDYHTNRETAPALDWWYKQNGKEPHSNGCNTCATAGDMPITTLPNLSFEPGKGSAKVDDLISGVKKGLIFNAGGWGSTDQQGYSGTYRGTIVQEVRNGKIIGHVKDAAYQFRTRQFWKSLDAVGDKSTIHTTGVEQAKGEPYQTFYQSISAPAARFRNVNIINTGRSL